VDNLQLGEMVLDFVSLEQKWLHYYLSVVWFGCLVPPLGSFLIQHCDKLVLSVDYSFLVFHLFDYMCFLRLV
jgi:hypothetical protein